MIVVIHGGMMGTPDVKKRTNISVSGALLDEAREMGLNVSGIAESALEQAVRKERARRWQMENAAAISERKDWIERNGMPLADVQVMRT
jgi:antitoxin CcdA